MSRKKAPPIDREKVRVAAQNLNGAGLRVWLNRAIDLLPNAAFPALIDDYVNIGDVLADTAPRPDILQVIETFHRESLARCYYESFNVDSRNYMKFSRGTETFIAEHARLLDACLEAERAGDSKTAAEGLALLIDLMRVIDEGGDDIVLFADEAGSWQCGVPWERVLPAWFRSLSRTVDADTWAETVADALEDFAGHKLDELLAAARDAATPEQRAALATYEADLRDGW